MNKKASLQLSINTIVLLVLALVLVGLVIGAFTGLFTKSKEQLLDSVFKVDIGIKASAYDEIAGADAFRFKRNKNQIMAFSFYNNGHEECVEFAEPVYYCPPGVLYAEDYEVVELSVPIGEERTIGGVLKMGWNVPSREYVCSIKVRCGTGQLLVAEQHTVFKVT